MSTKCRQTKEQSKFPKRSSNKDGLYSWCKDCSSSFTAARRKDPEYAERHRQYLKKNIAKTLLYSAKRRSKLYNIPFDIAEGDIIIPEFCPILKIPIHRGQEKVHPGSPSLDRIVPELGYVKGNIQVISYKANTMKSDATLMELLNFAQWVLALANT